MGVYQKFRGDPENKLFYLLGGLVGGINTEFSDDASADVDFNTLVNFDTDKLGTLEKRNGFGVLPAITAIFNNFGLGPQGLLPSVNNITEDLQNPEEYNDNIVYMKLLRNDNNCFRNLSAFNGPFAYREYQKLYGFQNNQFHLLIITVKEGVTTSWLYKCTLPELQYAENGNEVEDVETLTITCDKKTLPVTMKFDKNLMNPETIEFFDKIYLTGNDKGLICFDRETEEFSYSGFSENSVENAAYKPTALEVSRVGFNVLGDNPLEYINFQNISTDSIQGIFITTTDRIPVLSLPTGPKFLLNILYTGPDSEFEITLNEGGNELSKTATVMEDYSTPGLKCYEIVFSTIPTTEVEIKIEKIAATIEPFYDYYEVEQVDAEAKRVEPLNIGDYGMLEMQNRAVFYKGDTIWFSDVNNFSYIPNYNYITLPIEPIDRITKICYFRGVYVVFTKFRIYKLVGSFGTDEFELQPINLSLGCHAGNTVVPIENTLYFASPRGLYALKSSEYREGLENLTEIDIKVKKLTSDFTLYEEELKNPSVRFNGISERAYALRYKDKYLLFYNSSYEKGDYAAKNNLDVLVYNYEMKAFSSYRFIEKPTFLFMVDGAIETFCQTLQEGTAEVEPETQINYDFIYQDLSSGTVTDSSGNGNSATIVGDISNISESYNITNENYIEAELGNIDLMSNLNLDLDIKLGENTEEKTLIDFNSVGEDVVYLSGYNTTSENDMVFVEKIETETGETKDYNIDVKVTYNSRVSKTYFSDTSIKTYYTVGLALVDKEYIPVRDLKYSGTLTLKRVLNGEETILMKYDEEKGENVPIDKIAFEVNVPAGSNPSVTLLSGYCIDDVVPQEMRDYNFKLKYDLDFTYINGEEYYEKGADVVDSSTKKTEVSWISIGIPYKFVAYDGYSKFTVTKPFIKTTARLNVPSRDLVVSVAGKKMTFDIPSISGTGTHTSSQTKSVDITYPDSVLNSDGVYKVTVKNSYKVNATLSGVGYDEVTMSFQRTMPKIIHHTGSEVKQTLSSTQDISMTYVGTQMDFLVKYTTDNTLILMLGVGDILTSLETLEIPNPRERHLININRDTQNNINILCDGKRIGYFTPASVFYEKRPWSEGLYGTDKNKTNYLDWEMFSLTSEAFKYNTQGNVTIDDAMVTLTDKSGKGNSGTMFKIATTTNYEGAYVFGEGSYVSIGNVPMRWSKGFTLEAEFAIDELGETFKIFDTATAYGNANKPNKNCSINLSVDPDGFVSFNATTSKYKSFTISSKSPLTAYTRHKVKVESVIGADEVYTVNLYIDSDLPSVSTKVNYNPFEDIERPSTFIGKSNDENDGYFKGTLYNFIVVTAGYEAPYYNYGTIYEFDTAYSDFGKPIYFELSTKGLNLQYPQHIKKLKHIFLKVKGGYTYKDLLFEVYNDGYIVNDPTKYYCYVDDNGQVVYDYTVEANLSVNERVSVIGNMELGRTKLGEGNYQTRKMVIPAKGKNFKVKLYGEHKDYMSLESFGFVSKLGKVKQD